MRSIFNFFAISCFIFVSTIYTSISFAQSSEGIEEIVVTARKKEENIQETALSVSALSARDIENRFPSDIRDLAGESPNLIIDDLQQGPGSPTAIFIRGVGVSDVEKNFDPTTGVLQVKENLSSLVAEAPRSAHARGYIYIYILYKL